ncbi:MAG TPA: barstar family protein [Nocardioides sp.]|jgi:hypothetical protein
MTGLAALMAGRRVPGIYRWHAAFGVADVQHSVEHAGGRFAYLDGWKSQSKDEFLTAIGEAFGFPDYYGRNFDALLDCLRDVGSYPDNPDSEGGTVLLWDGWGTFARADERAFSMALSVLGQRVDEREAGKFSVLLRGEGPDLSDVPSLD